MASIREDLEADDALRQSTALLQILNYVAGGRDVSTNISFMCQTIIRGPAAPLVKKLAYDVVHAAPLSDSDWSLVIEGLRSDIVGTFSLEVQLSALSTLPSLPAYKLSSALLDGEIGPRLEPCLESSSKEVRAGALVAVGTWLGSADALLALKDSSVLWAHASKWAASAGDALLDTAHAVCAAAFAAVRQLLEAERAPLGSGAAVLQERLRRTVCNRVLASLPAVLNRARLLAPREQADVASALAAILLFAAGCNYDLEVEGHGSVPGKQVGQSQGPWLLAQVVEYLQPLLNSIEAPVVFEAARAILALATVSDGALTAAPTLAVGALVDLWDHDSSGAARVQIMEALTQKLGALQGQAQFQLLRQLLPMVAQLPGAAARCAALARIWAAAVAADLDTRRAVRTRQRTLPSTELRQLLSDATLMEVIGGLDSGEKDSVAPDAHYPAFREELVCTLLETLLRHPRAAQLSQPSDAPGQATAAGPVEDGAGEGNVLETRPGTPASGGAWEELQAAVHDVAAAQRTAELTEWLGCVKIALQGTKACLGWEREPQGGTYACTAVTDAWLALLQTAFAAARSVPKQAATPAASRRATAEADARVGTAVVSYSAALQELLAQLLQHWKALSPAVQPRALWVVAHHLELASSMDTACMNLLRALADALAANESLVNSRRRRAAKTAASEGRLEAAASNNPFASGKTDVALAATADEAEAAAEAAAVALLATERFAALLASNFERLGPQPGLKEMAANLTALLKAAIAGPRASAESRERLNRTMALIDPVASSALPPQPSFPAEGRGSIGGSAVPDSQADKAAPDGQAAPEGQAMELSGGKLQPLSDRHVLSRCPLASPTSAVLQETKRGSRYWRLRSAVQEAVAAACGDPGVHPCDQPECTLPELSSMPSPLEVLRLATSVPGEVRWQELTAPGDPLQLRVTHSLDAGNSTLTLQFQACNRLTVEIKNAGIKLAFGGPMVPAIKMPPVHKLSSIPAGEAVTWRLAFIVLGFGRLTLQAFILLPAKVSVLPGEEPSLRCQLFTVSPMDLLGEAGKIPPDVFFQQWASMPSGWQVVGSATKTGVAGGLAALSALERSRLRRIVLHALPAQGGFLAAYSGRTWWKAPVALVLTAQLLPAPAPAVAALANGPGRLVLRASFRSTDPEAASVLSADLPATLTELFAGSIALGAASEGVPAAPMDAPREPHSALRPLAQLYAVPKTAAAGGVGGAENGSRDGLAELESVTRGVGLEAAVLGEWQRVRSARLQGAN